MVGGSGHYYYLNNRLPINYVSFLGAGDGEGRRGDHYYYLNNRLPVNYVSFCVWGWERGGKGLVIIII